MSFARVRLQVASGVAALTVSGADAGNSIDEITAAELREALGDLDDRPDVMVVVLTGDGPNFCRGTTLPVVPTAEQMAAHSVASSVAGIGKPTVAAIEGDALDQGLELALACDMRVVGEHARLGMTQAAEGGLPWDGGTQRLPRLIGRSRALEMLLMARVLGGQEAAAIGLATEVTAPGRALERAMDAARVMEAHGPLALRYLKEAVYKGADLSLDQAMRMEGDLATLLHSTQDRAEGLRAFADKRRPEFTGE